MSRQFNDDSVPSRRLLSGETLRKSLFVRDRSRRIQPATDGTCIPDSCLLIQLGYQSPSEFTVRPPCPSILSVRLAPRNKRTHSVRLLNKFPLYFHPFRFQHFFWSYHLYTIQFYWRNFWFGFRRFSFTYKQKSSKTRTGRDEKCDHCK